MTDSQVIIIGFGPSGMACAIQLTRMGLRPLVIEKSNPGGMLVNANLVENYPGFPGGIKGDKLVRLFKKQASTFNINLVGDEITDVIHNGRRFELKGKKVAYESEILVLATGTIPVVPAECPAQLIRKGLIHTDISLLRKTTGKTIGIIGAGDAAFDYAVSMAENGNTVHIFNRSERVRALGLLQDKAEAMSGIKYFEHYRAMEMTEAPDGRLRAVFGHYEQSRSFLMDYLIFATGRIPALKYVNHEFMNKMKILEQQKQLYLIGDVRNGNVRQVSVAVGDGVRAAMEIAQHESHQQD
ncbi:MAG: NAD(P)/FAD-dependent oxidoreductase [Bacteroidales bacterium]|nr:NAD(P)/FAD-dependent oxidoreductase [Bacteroidales bacterium]